MVLPEIFAHHWTHHHHHQHHEHQHHGHINSHSHHHRYHHTQQSHNYPHHNTNAFNVDINPLPYTGSLNQLISSIVDDRSSFPPNNDFNNWNITDSERKSISNVTTINSTMETVVNAAQAMFLSEELQMELTTVPTNVNTTISTVNSFETMRFIKIGLLALMFILIFCGNVFVLIALNVSTANNINFTFKQGEKSKSAVLTLAQQ